jgi:hypothetical protein
MQLASQCSVLAVHAFDSCPVIAAAAAAASVAKLQFSCADAEDVRICTRGCSAETCSCEPFQLLPLCRFDAVIDQSALDALAAIDAACAHHSLACSYAALRPGGVCLLLSALMPPARALPLLRAAPGCAWEIAVAHAPAGSHAYVLTKPPARSLLVSGDRVVPAAHDAVYRHDGSEATCSFRRLGRVMVQQPLYDWCVARIKGSCSGAYSGCLPNYRRLW